MTPVAWHQEAVVPLPRSAAVASPADQLTLMGEPRPVGLPAEVWHALLSNPDVVARFERKRFRARGGQCWPWLGAVSSCGHGAFRAATLPGTSRGIVGAHQFAYQLAYGVIFRFGWSGVEDPVICHRCDSHGCTNPDHLRLGTIAENAAEWAQRHRDPTGPLADVRGAAGRTRAIADAVRVGLAARESREQIEERIRTAEAEGRPFTLW